MSVKIALAGNPNSGKTTLFNSLTGSNQYVGNWPGVTVEKKTGKLKKHNDIEIIDLPGIYSLSPYSLEEVVARDYLINENPDVILNIVDGTNLERNLYLTNQLLEVGIPVVVAINMIDIVRKNGDKINYKKLSDELGCDVIEISALKGISTVEAALAAVNAAKTNNVLPISKFSDTVEIALDKIKGIAKFNVSVQEQRWFAVKVFERDEKVLEKLNLTSDELKLIENIISTVEEKYNDDSESIITNERYNRIGDIVKHCYKRNNKEKLTVSDKIDKVITNRWLAIPIFAVIMFAVYAIAMGPWTTPWSEGGPFISIGTYCTDWANDVLFGEWVPNLFDSLLGLVGVAESSWVYGLIQDGIVAGVGAVLGFVPQMIVLFIFLSMLEECGYMSRIAFIMDRMFRKFGLSGKSFIPMLVSTGCGVPGIMASRTIEQDRDRKMTIMTTGFIPCSAKMPIIGLFAGAIFGNSPLVATSAFFIGIAAVVISGIILKKFKKFAGEPAPFVMELPAYHLPVAKNVFHSTWERATSFIKRAGTIILLSSIVLWFLQGYGIVDGQFMAVEDNNESLLAAIGHGIAWLFYPLGWMGDMAWKAAVATITGLIAKEEVVNTFGVLYHSIEELDEVGTSIWPAVAQDFGPVRAYSFMIFNLLCAPCFAAMGAIKREMNNGKWTAFAIAYMCGFAYVISMIVYQIAGLFTGEASFGIFTVVAIAALVALVYLLFRKGYKPQEEHRLTSNVKNR